MTKMVKLNKVPRTLSIKYAIGPCFVGAGRYPNGRVALVVFAPDGEQLATATVNLPDEPCADNEIFVKDYSENEGMADFLVKEGFIEPNPTGFARSGFVTIYRYQLSKSALSEMKKPGKE
jgi:hypothetical protein